MSRNYIYSQVEPENNKDLYLENDNIEFTLTGSDDMAYLKNSLKFEADVNVKINGARVVAQKVFVDPRVGGHSFIDSIRVSTLEGQVENISSDYPRYIAMKATATESRNDTLNGSRACEGKTPDIELSQSFYRGQYTQNNQAQIVTNNDISIKPMCCLNRIASGSGNVAFNRVGLIRVSLILSRNNGALFCTEPAGSALSYELSNVKLSYVQVPVNMSMDSQAVNCKSAVPIKQIINSSSASVSSKIPSSCNGVSISFQRAATEYSNLSNNVRMDNVDGLQRVEFNYNDVANMGIQYPITDRGEMLHRFVNSFGGKGHSQVNPDRSTSGHFGLGYDFGLYKNLSTQKFNTMIKTSGINNVNQYIIYLYFHSVVSM